MKKRILSILLIVVMVMSAVACGGKDEPITEKSSEAPPVAEDAGETVEAEEDAEEDLEEAESLSIGCAIQTMGNQVWAQQMESITENANKDGHKVTVVECQENANTQIGQLENFITSGMDIIIVQPVDPDAIEEVCGQALDQDITVVCWDEEMENSTFNWVIANYDLGLAIGEEAAAFINEKHGDEGCEVVVLGYPQTPILLERENGILESLSELAPGADVVANQPAIDTTQGLNAMETILQSHPNVKVVCCIGGGGAAGANEAFKAYYGDEVPDDMGIFSTDLTEEFVASVQNDEFNRSCIAITGNAYVCGEEIYNLSVSYHAGELTDKNVHRDLIPVTKDNLDDFI